MKRKIWDYGLIAAFSKKSNMQVLPIYALHGDGIGFELEDVQRIGDYKRRLEFKLVVKCADRDYAKIHSIAEVFKTITNLDLYYPDDAPIGQIQCKNMNTKCDRGGMKMYFIGLLKISRKARNPSPKATDKSTDKAVMRNSPPKTQWHLQKRMSA